MKKAIFFILDEYADWEPAYLSSMINKQKDWLVETASIQKEVYSIGGFKTLVDYELSNLPAQIDLFVLIGGNYWEIENDALKELVARLLDQKVAVGAICGAVDYLAKNGLLTDYQHTGNARYFWHEFPRYTNATHFHEVQAIRDRNLVTANGTAPVEFAKLMLEAIDFADQTKIDSMINMYKLGYYDYVEQFGNPYL